MFIIILIISIIYNFASVVAGFCYINEATQVQKYMMLRGTSDIINSNVNAMIQKYSLRTGVQSSQIKNCIKTQQQKKQEYLSKKVYKPKLRSPYNK